MSPVNVQVNQNYVDPNQAQLQAQANAGQIAVGVGGGAVPVAPVRQPVAEQPEFRTGTLVEGQVLAQNLDGTYLVRVTDRGEGRNDVRSRDLRARATLPLLVGERFRAVWDTSGFGPNRIPLLRLSQQELSFLSQVPERDRELATLLLARGMPLSKEVMAEIQSSWRRLGSEDELLSPMIELWARGVPMTTENATLVAQYLMLSGNEANAMWERIRRDMKSRTLAGDEPIKVIREMKEGNGDQARFLQAHSILMRAPKPNINFNPMLLAAPFWPMPEGSKDMTARVFVGRTVESDTQRYWQVGFGISGSHLGNVGGIVESDGRACNLTLNAERPDTCELLDERRGEIRSELATVALPVQYIGVARVMMKAVRERLLAGRGLDVTV